METKETVETTDVNQEGIVPPPTEEDLVGYKSTPGFEPAPTEVVEKKEPAPAEKTVEKPVGDSEPYVYNTVWENLKEQGIEIPKNVIEGKFEEGKTEHDAIVQAIIDNTEFPGENDPFIKGYLQSEDKDGYLEDYRTIKSITKMSPDEGLRFIFKNELDDKGERANSDEDIEEEMGKMTTLQKKREWKAYTDNVQQMQEQMTVKREQENKEAVMKNIETVQEQRLQIVNTLLADEDKIAEINGIPYTEDMRNQFKKDFTELNKIDPETGIPFFNTMLMDNNILMDVMRAYSLIKDNRIKHHISSAKEQVKKEVLERTDLNPKIKSGTTKKVVGNTDSDYDV